jgi:hypothetical protein
LTAIRWYGQCTPPPFLVSSSPSKQLDTDYFELYTLGRYITVRPEVTSSGTSVFGNGSYAYLGDRHRVFALWCSRILSWR